MVCSFWGEKTVLHGSSQGLVAPGKGRVQPQGTPSLRLDYSTKPMLFLLARRNEFIYIASLLSHDQAQTPEQSLHPRNVQQEQEDAGQVTHEWGQSRSASKRCRWKGIPCAQLEDLGAQSPAARGKLITHLPCQQEK